MSLFGNYMEESAPEVERAITIEEYAFLVDKAMDFLFESDDEFITESELLLVEGKLDNKKITDKFYEMKKKYKAEIKEFKKLYKIANKTRDEKDIKNAKDSLDGIIKILEEYRDEIKAIDAGSVSNIIIGFLLNQLITVLSLLPVIPVSIVFNNTRAAKRSAAFTLIIENLSNLYNSFKKYKKTGNTDTKQLNMYRSRVITIINDYIKQVRAMYTALDNLKV